MGREAAREKRRAIGLGKRSRDARSWFDRLTTNGGFVEIGRLTTNGGFVESGRLTRNGGFVESGRLTRNGGLHERIHFRPGRSVPQFSLIGNVSTSPLWGGAFAGAGDWRELPQT